MRPDDALPFLHAKGVAPHQVMECCMPGCTEKRKAAFFKALPASCGRDEEGNQVRKIFFFCSYECYLGGIPIEGNA